MSRLKKKSSVLGSYTPNQFFISMSAKTPFIIENSDGDLEQNNAHLPIFLHEYWHFLHNITTISGFTSFSFSQHLLGIFSKTLSEDRDGTSEGSGNLNSDLQGDIQSLLDILGLQEGDDKPEGNFERDLIMAQDFKILEIHEHNIENPLDSHKIKAIAIEFQVEIFWNDYTANGEFIFGSYQIEESIAIIVEEIISGIKAEVPIFPYRVLEKVFLYKLGRIEKPFIMAALGTLSLMSPYPGPTILNIVNSFALLVWGGMSSEDALSQIIEEAKLNISEISKVVLRDLDDFVSMHEGRGLLEHALVWLRDMFEKSLKFRKEDPIFDLNALQSVEKIQKLHEHFPPCNVLQGSDASEKHSLEKNMLLSFGNEELDNFGHKPTDYLRSLQAQQAFVFAHIDLDEEKIKPSSKCISEDSQCPFYSSCGLPWRVTQPSICRMSPWLHWKPEGNACWYITAVNSTLGKVKIDRLIE